MTNVSTNITLITLHYILNILEIVLDIKVCIYLLLYVKLSYTINTC